MSRRLLAKDNFLKAVFVAVVYFILAVSSLTFSFHSSNATPVWPASGFAFVALLLWKPKIIPGIFLGAFSANVYVFLNNHTCAPFTAIWVSALIGIGNCAEAIAGYYLLQKFMPGIKAEQICKNVPAVLGFVIAALLMCLTSCTIGATSILLGGIIVPEEFFTVWFTWWTGDASGILLFTPLILSWKSSRLKELFNVSNLRMLEAVFLSVAIVITSGTVFGNLFKGNFVFTRAFIITPFLIWAAIRLDQRLVAFLVLISAAIAIEGSLKGIGPFAGPSLNDSLLTVEVFVSVNAVMALLLSAAVFERKEKENFLQNARNELEDIVAERTKELNEKNEQLQQRNKELTLFSYAVSHDLQEPLRKIEFFAGKILEDEERISEKGKDYFQRIRGASVKMKRLIENLLSYSIVEGNTPLPEKTDLNLVLHQVKMDLDERIGETGCVFESDTLPVIKGIAIQLQQLFTNIISNSIKFKKPDEQLHIRIESEILKETATNYSAIAPGQQYYHLSFIDNGIGFEPQYADTVFEILQKLHGQSEYEGTGIGLAICKKVVENHKGFITANGEPGQGCTIHVYLPVDNSSSPAVVLKEGRIASERAHNIAE